MKNIIKFQVKNALSNSVCLIMIILTCAFGVISFILKCISTYKMDIIEVPSAFTQFFFNAFNMEYVAAFGIILPFLSCATFSDSYVTDIKSNYICISITKTGIKQYYFSKLISAFICGALIVFIPQIINYILCLIAFPYDSTYEYSWDLWQSNFFTVRINEFFLFKDIYIFSPYLYFLLYVLISSIVSGVISVIAYQFSFIIPNRIFVLSFMFVIMNLSFRFFDTKGLPFDINEYIFGNYVGGQTYHLMTVIFLVYLTIALLPTPFALKKLRNCL